MLPDVSVPTYDQAYSNLGSVYDPQTAQVNTEISQLQPLQDAQQASLDQAKVNAFRDITTAANNKGVLFSGFTPDQQAQYVGTKYLPAVANLKATFQNNKNTLLDKINAINAQRATQAQGIVSNANTAATNNAYKNAQLALAQQRLAISAARASSASSSGGITPYEQIQLATKAAAGYKVKQGSNGQYMFTNKNGTPINMNQFIQGSGGSGQDLINMLANGTGYDRKVLANAARDKAYQQAVNNEDYAALTNVLKKYDTGKYYGF